MQLEVITTHQAVMQNKINKHIWAGWEVKAILMPRDG